MFLPMSWMSPFTVAMTILPGYSLPRSPFIPALSASKAAPAASALMSSCGRYISPASKPLPTLSSAGISSEFITSSGSVPPATSRFASFVAASVRPFSMHVPSVMPAACV